MQQMQLSMKRIESPPGQKDGDRHHRWDGDLLRVVFNETRATSDHVDQV